MVCLQHEYGIFGGPAGSHILALLRRLKMPLVTILHTVLRKPTLNQQVVLEEIARLSDRLIVMSELASTLLQSVYGAPADKIDMIPHGVPDFAFTDPNYFKDLFNIQGKPVLWSWGFLPTSSSTTVSSVLRNSWSMSALRTSTSLRTGRKRRLSPARWRSLWVPGRQLSRHLSGMLRNCSPQGAAFWFPSTMSVCL